MKKKFRTLAGLAGLLCLTGGTSAYAVDSEMLQRQVEELLVHNRKLTERITALEKRQGQSQGTDNAAQGQQEGDGEKQKINEMVAFVGLIEGEAVFGDDFDGNSSSEFNVATVELGFEAMVSEWAAGEILVKYEGPDDNLFVDEAMIKVGNYDNFPLQMTAGKFYVPFGSFETNMVQDPLTLEIGEINDYGVALGFESNGMFGAVYGYNGMKETGHSETISGFGARVGYGYENENMSLETGLSWVSNLADSGGISDYFDESGLESVQKRVEGIAFSLLAGIGPVSFVGEYVQALDEFSEISFEGHGSEPKAWNAELAYSAEILARDTVFAVGYQGSDEAVELGLPEDRYLAVASMIILPGTALTLEYCYNQDYDASQGGTGGNSNSFTTQLAYEF